LGHYGLYSVYNVHSLVIIILASLVSTAVAFVSQTFSIPSMSSSFLIVTAWRMRQPAMNCTVRTLAAAGG
jgi:hypothetical protein